jgi:hypothetical protein
MSGRMTPYRRLAGDSGVTAYRIATEAIDVRFVDGRVYTYTYESAGPVHIENMKLLAQAGQGLSTYISQHVRDRYAKVAG